MYQVIDCKTKEPVYPTNLVFTGEHSAWQIQMDIEKIKKNINLNYFKSIPAGLVKYLPLLPIREISEFVSLQETATPLVKSNRLAKQLGIDLYFKVEGKNPTGSFKDRGSAVEISIAKEHNTKGIILASTGNMAASCACYAAAANIACYILVPEGVPTAKLSQALAYGGRVVQVKGNYNDAARMAFNLAQQFGFYLAGDYAFRVEGQKTAAFELIDQFSCQTPDVVIVPIGCGTNIAAYAKGFFEYQQLGITNYSPALLGVQAKGAAAVVNSFQNRKSTITPLKKIETIASAIAVSDPVDGIKALDAIKQTQGSAIAVSDDEILRAKMLLAREEGLFVEAASATTLAAVLALQSSDYLYNKKVVCVLTGDGLKDATMQMGQEEHLPLIEPDENAFTNLHLFTSTKGEDEYKR